MITAEEIEELRKRNPFPKGDWKNEEEVGDLWLAYVHACKTLERMRKEGKKE